MLESNRKLAWWHVTFEKARNSCTHACHINNIYGSRPTACFLREDLSPTQRQCFRRLGKGGKNKMFLAWLKSECPIVWCRMRFVPATNQCTSFLEPACTGFGGAEVLERASFVQHMRALPDTNTTDSLPGGSLQTD